MGWKTLQSADEVARTLLTHQCRYRPGLKLRPEHCEAYRGKKDNPKATIGLSSDAQLCLQWDCPGPVEINTLKDKEASPPVQEEGREPASERSVGSKIIKKENEKKQIVEVRRYKGDTTCRICGKKNGEAEFYPTRPDTCIQCLKQRKIDQRTRASAIADRIKQQREETKHKYLCEEHGPHNGRKMGKNFSPICPECFRLNLIKKIGERKEGITKNSVVLPEWLVSWAVEHGEMLGLNANEFLVDKLAPLVEADWLKEWVIKNKGKI